MQCVGRFYGDAGQLHPTSSSGAQFHMDVIITPALGVEAASYKDGPNRGTYISPQHSLRISSTTRRTPSSFLYSLLCRSLASISNMFTKFLSLWATTLIIGTSSLALNVATNRFIYPDQSSVLNLHAGDIVNVTWISSFKNPWLQLNCDHIKKRKYSLSYLQIYPKPNLHLDSFS